MATALVGDLGRLILRQSAILLPEGSSAATLSSELDNLISPAAIALATRNGISSMPFGAAGTVCSMNLSPKERVCLVGAE